MMSEFLFERGLGYVYFWKFLVELYVYTYLPENSQNFVEKDRYKKVSIV